MDEKAYQELLDKHDWYYHASGDIRSWRAGLDSEKKLKGMFNDNPLFEQMYRKKELEAYPKDVPPF